MTIAIYSRKSKLTEKGDSVQNQIDMCKGYAFLHFSVSENDIAVYVDEGFSAKNTDRPKFKALMQDIAQHRFDILMCYKLDRISRNVLDFSNILDSLTKTGTSFVSITEHFDTTTPMGRAMVNIAAVFAQLERETIAERIRDNLRRLARTGRYLGSTPPFGFASERIDYTDPNGNKKKMHQLAPVEEDMQFVELIYEKYLELEGLAKVETWLMKNGTKNRNGNYTGTSELRRLLTNPVYVKADKAVYDYYTKIGADVVDTEADFNGRYGMLVYGRHDRNNGAFDPTKWTVVLAKHEGVIKSSKWLAAQRLLAANKNKAPRSGSSRDALLTSKIRCANCGGTMVVTYGSNPDRHYYKCRNKIKSRKTICDISNITGQTADAEVYNYLTSLPTDRNRLADALKNQGIKTAVNPEDSKHQALRLKKLIQEKESSISHLTLQLRAHEASAAAKYIIADIESIDAELANLRTDQLKIEKQKDSVNDSKTETDWLHSSLLDLGKTTAATSLEEKRRYIDQIIDTIYWNGKELHISFR